MCYIEVDGHLQRLSITGQGICDNNSLIHLRRDASMKEVLLHLEGTRLKLAAVLVNMHGHIFRGDSINSTFRSLQECAV